MIYPNHKNHVSFESMEGFCKDPFLALYSSLFLINDLPASLLFSSAFFSYAGDSSKEFLSLLYKAFLRCVLTYA